MYLSVSMQAEGGINLNRWRRCVMLFIAGFMVLFQVQAQAQAQAQSAAPASDAWRYAVTPYLWLPSLDGTLRYGPPAAGGASPNVSVDSSKLIDALDFAMMVNAEARKGKWSIATDLIYLDLSSDKSGVRSINFNPGTGPVDLLNTSLNLGTEVEVKGTVWTLAGGYAVVQTPRHHLDVIGGFRYFDLEATTRWNLSAVVTGPVGAANFSRTGSVTQNTELWDVIVGLRGRSSLGNGRWFAPYYLDAGGGDSKLTWQGAAGVGYQYKWGDLSLVYRYLSYQQSGNKLVQELNFGGLALGATFRF